MNSLNSTHVIVKRIHWLKNVTKIIEWLQRTVLLRIGLRSDFTSLVVISITILFTQNVREPKWLPNFHLTGAIFSLRKLWLPCSRVFVVTVTLLEVPYPAFKKCPTSL